MSNNTLQIQPSLADQNSMPRDSVPVFVDLDGTLTKTDLLIESTFFLLEKTTVVFIVHAVLVGIW